MNATETYEYKGMTVEIIPDEDVESPREWDNLGSMACFHNRYNLGDKHDLSIEEVKKIANSDEYISLPLYLYDHSGITMSTSSFSCPWDSGQVGIIFVSKDDARLEYGWKTITKARYQKILERLQSEVKIYDQFITGDVYGYSIDNDEMGWENSCWGFYGIEDCKQQANEVIDDYLKQEEKKEGKQLELAV